MTTEERHRREDIKTMIRKRFLSIRQFQRDFGLPYGSVNDVLGGKSRPQVAQVMADALGVGIHELFPDRYTANGDTIIRRTRKTHRLSAEAQ